MSFSSGKNSAAHGAAEAERLADSGRFDEALALYRTLLAGDPLNPALHQDYNGLLYRLGRTEDYLKSFDRAPPNRMLYLTKAQFLMHEQRHDEAAEVFSAILARDAADKHAGAGLAIIRAQQSRHDQAAKLFDTLLARHGGDANLWANAAKAALMRGDAKAALALCEKGLAAAPQNQACLALMGTAFRLLKDARDETLNRYDTLIGVFDLEPPQGFSSMADFNAELDRSLDPLHVTTREHVGQSLRGGSQTMEHVFGAGHDLIDRLEKRIRTAVDLYIAGLTADARHPFLSRRGAGFGYSGSWSSRLAGQGFHANHFHPEGWISSCYYVAVPDAVADEQAKPSWIKFGQPDFETGLAARHAIKPVSGRLVLFPSYMWHGTNGFEGPGARTTIAFDAVPV